MKKPRRIKPPGLFCYRPVWLDGPLSMDFEKNESVACALGILECPGRHKPLVGIVERPLSVVIFDDGSDDLIASLEPLRVLKSGRCNDGRFGHGRSFVML
jgi:hypothetical protein